MRTSIKNILIAIAISVGNFFLNFFVFTLSYNRLATPFLVEEQRVENADFIMSVTAGSFAIVAILTCLVVYGVLSLKKNQVGEFHQ